MFICTSIVVLIKDYCGAHPLTVKGLTPGHSVYTVVALVLSRSCPLWMWHSYSWLWARLVVLTLEPCWQGGFFVLTTQYAPPPSISRSSLPYHFLTLYTIAINLLNLCYPRTEAKRAESTNSFLDKAMLTYDCSTKSGHTILQFTCLLPHQFFQHG